MKKQKTLLTLATLISLFGSSCSDDEKTTTEDPLLLIGQWKIESETVDGLATEYGSCGGDILNITASGTFNSYGFYFNNDTCNEDGNEYGDWSEEENVLILKYDASMDLEDEHWIINSINETQLKLTEESIEGEKIVRTFNKL
ncbi:lipocalin family protein [Aestuariibaculum sp. M13]|uniref:lipocalin family protein n=1 Tax=Aestuariibaculum sp. M13 TaxID=2967132 RepID=UPI002159F16C|nr:lipocalin family protein [Aestuariibaculum sp. M13]MCR8666533.1 lipocalin family protein [Aestuariibaculum sp. M13]